MIAFYLDVHVHVPRILSIKREMIEFLVDGNECMLEMGDSSTLLLAKYEGIDVGVKRYHEDIPSSRVRQEALTIYNLGLHSSIPLLFGIFTDERPFLAVYKFYGSKSMKKPKTLKMILDCKESKLDSYNWILIIIQIANGIAYFHANHHVHGAISENHIILYPNENMYNIKFVGLGNSLQVGNIDAINQDLSALAKLIPAIYRRLDQKHPSLSYFVSKMHKRKPTAKAIADKFSDIFESGHFDP